MDALLLLVFGYVTPAGREVLYCRYSCNKRNKGAQITAIL